MNSFASFLTAAVMGAFGAATTTAPSLQASQACVTITKTLFLGSRGDEVAQLQVFLNVQKSGYFGPLTQRKLIQWQIAKKLIVSANSAGAGTTGPKTRAMMRCSTLSLPITRSVPAAVAQAATSTSSSTPSITAPAAAPASGGAGVVTPSVSPSGYACSQLGNKPVSACDGGSWQLSVDEADCIIWACLVTDLRG